jgi:hypothetical protein
MDYLKISKALQPSIANYIPQYQQHQARDFLVKDSKDVALPMLYFLSQNALLSRSFLASQSSDWLSPLPDESLWLSLNAVIPRRLCDNPSVGAESVPAGRGKSGGLPAWAIWTLAPPLQS